MPWFAIYDTGAANELRSITDTPPGVLPGNLASVNIGGRPDFSLVQWDSVGLTMVARVAPKVEHESTGIPRAYEFWQMWKAVHAEAIVRAASAQVLTALSNKEDAAWGALLAEIQAWRTAP